MAGDGVVPFVGVYDVFSATIAARYYDGLFLSGFSFAASHYGLPDIGFIAWSDLVSFVYRVRALLPGAHLLVDLDDGYGDVEVACHVVSLLETAGVAGIVLEDQQRPRRCGHLDGKQILPLDTFLPKLERVLKTRRELVVVARTDATETDEITRRVRAFDAAGADALLVDGVKDLEMIRMLRGQVSRPLVFNQIAGGKSPTYSLRELGGAGVSLAIYSTPCLFAAQAAVEQALRFLKENDGVLPEPGLQGAVGVKECTAVLQRNLEQRSRCEVDQYEE